MDWLLVVVVVSFAAGGGYLYLQRKGKGEKVKGEHFPSGITVEEETGKGCPDRVKQKLKEQHKKLMQEADKFYKVIDNLIGNRRVSQQLQKELEAFMRSYNRIKEMEEEIEVYPFKDCEKAFELKFNFYKGLLEESAKKIVSLLKSGSK